MTVLLNAPPCGEGAARPMGVCECVFHSSLHSFYPTNISFSHWFVGLLSLPPSHSRLLGEHPPSLSLLPSLPFIMVSSSDRGALLCGSPLSRAWRTQPWRQRRKMEVREKEGAWGGGGRGGERYRTTCKWGRWNESAGKKDKEVTCCPSGAVIGSHTPVCVCMCVRVSTVTLGSWPSVCVCVLAWCNGEHFSSWGLHKWFSWQRADSEIVSPKIFKCKLFVSHITFFTCVCVDFLPKGEKKYSAITHNKNISLHFTILP